ncbi:MULTISPECIES: glucokinase [Pseudomonas]|jgi:glucokinase|uniref:Glucokinase n=3 Tax=Pseudomonas TaxID=286 RepID=A0A2X2CI44_PSELU|nr:MULTISPECIES: glucokinase [Pseudomonas]ENA30032.1 glucokinase [Pseudomonas sp. HPB0071]MBF8643621.1 glucokinase [Pseudomonas zeshuii]MBW5415979.1 glucokinase [Pseudomonas sp. MAG002Y]MCG7371784.1 glucokinase [Pseudomonas luteola]MDN3236864.1 glucokinase [Pseudomonas sp. WAC2]
MNLALVGDIGGTNARFALWRDQQLDAIEVMACADFERPEDAVREYLKRTGVALDDIHSVCLACAGPVGEGDFRFTNNHWVISRERFCAELGLTHLLLINDFSSMAWAVAKLDKAHCVQVREGAAHANRARLIIGPGTGLGVAGLLPIGDDRWMVLSSEGGHVDLPIGTPREFEIWKILKRQFGNHVSAERIISGNGLVNLYKASCELDGREEKCVTAAEICEMALSGDAYADEVLEQFFVWLGRVAGNAALTLGALGGVYIAGGILPRFVERFQNGAFAKAFADKGKTSSAYLQDIPAWLVTAEYPGLFGAGVALQQSLNGQ